MNEKARYVGIAAAYRGKLVEIVARAVRIDSLPSELVEIAVPGFADHFLVMPGDLCKVESTDEFRD